MVGIIQYYKNKKEFNDAYKVNHKKPSLKKREKEIPDDASVASDFTASTYASSNASISSDFTASTRSTNASVAKKSRASSNASTRRTYKKSTATNSKALEYAQMIAILAASAHNEKPLNRVQAATIVTGVSTTKETIEDIYYTHQTGGGVNLKKSTMRGLGKTFKKMFQKNRSRK